MIGVYNFRQVGDGPAATAIYRSSLLRFASPRTRRNLTRLGLSDIVDLRTERMHLKLPDPALPGVRNHLVDVIGSGQMVPGEPKDAVESDAAMRQRYRLMVSDPGQAAKVGEALRLLADAGGASLVHCTDGKDRTGWVVALVQHCAGDSPERIMADYVLSDDRVSLLAKLRFGWTLVRRGLARARTAHPVNVVRDTYLGAALEEAEARFGGVDAYLACIGVDATVRENLRRKVRPDA